MSLWGSHPLDTIPRGPRRELWMAVMQHNWQCWSHDSDNMTDAVHPDYIHTTQNILLAAVKYVLTQKKYLLRQYAISDKAIVTFLECVHFSHLCKVVESLLSLSPPSQGYYLWPLMPDEIIRSKNSSVITFMSLTNEKTDVILLCAWCARRSLCKSVLATGSGWKGSQNENGKSREPLSIMVAFTSPGSKEF